MNCRRCIPAEPSAPTVTTLSAFQSIQPLAPLSIVASIWARTSSGPYIEIAEREILQPRSHLQFQARNLGLPSPMEMSSVSYGKVVRVPIDADRPFVEVRWIDHRVDEIDDFREVEHSLANSLILRIDRDDAKYIGAEFDSGWP